MEYSYKPNLSIYWRFRQDQNGSLPAFQESAEPDIIACIDIGTTFSGYAFALSKDLQEDRLAVHVNKEWISGNSKLITLKVPSSVLLTPEKRFHSFGYEAEWKYGQLAADKNHLGWYYFRKFKMTMMQNEVKSISLTQFINFYFASIGQHFYHLSFVFFLYHKFLILKLKGGKVYSKSDKEIFNSMDSSFLFSPES